VGDPPGTRLSHCEPRVERGILGNVNIVGLSLDSMNLKRATRGRLAFGQIEKVLIKSVRDIANITLAALVHTLSAVPDR